MVYHDMQFTWGSALVAGASSPTVRAELIYQIERISHHPSVVILDGCNECGGGSLYETFVMPTVAATDQSRAVWPSCPSTGWLAGVDRLTSRANGQALRTGATSDPPRPAGNPPLEGHGPYIGLARGAGHLGEGHPLAPPCSPATMSAAVPKRTGPAAPSWYQSEFGCVAWSSFESISAQLPADQWSLHSSAAWYRNWPVDAVIQGFFGTTQKYETGAAAFKRQLYQSLLGQALFMKTEIEGWRSTNIFGSTIWMYNELWPTGGWGSIEYGGNTTGQVSGGRWKPLQYFFRATTFADQLATCNVWGACFIKNDVPLAFNGTVSLKLINVLSGVSVPLRDYAVSMAPGAGVTEWFCATPAPAPTPALAPATVLEPPLGGTVDVAHLRQRIEQPHAGATSLAGLVDRLGRGRSQYAYGGGELPAMGSTIVAGTGNYSVQQGLIPSDRSGFTETRTSCSPAVGAATCDAMGSGCLGFTMSTVTTPGQCWFYPPAAAPYLQAPGIAGAEWFQKPGTAPIYSQHPGQIPADTANFTSAGSGGAADCEKACTAEKSCLGFTMVGSHTGCWFYQSVNVLIDAKGDEWFQKPGTKAIPTPPPVPPTPPGPPAPPAPPAPPPLPCRAWADTPQWQAAGCDAMGANCLVTANVLEPERGDPIATNVLPFQPPKAMRLPADAIVTVTVGAPTGSDAVVPLTIRATKTALYVVLTTTVPGRFSENAFLVEATGTTGPPKLIDFVPWEEFGPQDLASLKATLRVEHLAQNL